MTALGPARPRLPAAVLLALLFLAGGGARPAFAQPAQRPDSLDPARIRELYVSDQWEDHPVADYARSVMSRA